MNLTPQDIAASIGDDPSIKAEEVLYEYLNTEGTIRYRPLMEFFSGYGMHITEQDMLRLLDLPQDILFTEGRDEQGRYWVASVIPEGYLDHRVTDQYEDAMPQNFEGEEEFTDSDMPGINAPAEPGEMGGLGMDGAGTGSEAMANGPGQFDTQTMPPDTDSLPMSGDQSEVAPAAVPRSMPDIVAQAMGGEEEEGLDQGFDPALEPGLPEPGMVPGDTVDIDQAGAPPAQPGPGEEQPPPQTGMQPQLQPQVVAPQTMVQPQGMVQPQQVQPVQQVPVQPVQQAQPQPQFGQDGADYTIDPFLNALGGMATEESDEGPGGDLPQSPQSVNAPAAGARTKQDKLYTKDQPPERYSARMKEAWVRRANTIVETFEDELGSGTRTADMRLDRPPNPSPYSGDIFQFDQELVQALQDPEKLEQIKQVLADHPETLEKLERIIRSATSRLGVNDFPPGTDIDSITANTMEPFS